MRGFLPAAVSLLLSLALAGAWTYRLVGASAGQKTIRFAYVGAPDDARHLSALRFQEQVERDSGGTLRVKLYYGGQLGGDRDAIEGVGLGTIEMTVAGAGVFANFEPQMGVTALPFFFDGFEEAWAFNDSPLNAQICRRLERRGLRVLGHWDNGFRCITNSVRPINSPEDLRGLTIRTPENPIILATMAALGANPSPLPWPELYMALQQRAFDGQENPVPTIYVNKLYEVQEHLSITDHAYEPMPVVVSEVFWSGLSEREREIIRTAVLESQRFNRSLTRQRTDEMLAGLQEEGMIITHPDRKPFEESTRHVRDQLAASIGRDLVEEVVRFVEKQRSEVRGQRSEIRKATIDLTPDP